ncbi:MULTISPECIES: ABC transporter substrate-binding protein [Microbacterium]|uniref:ABC transporter substrate-binding protein n=1 Tax=Microbacterium wangchenii TaxID=2541726 RepID=A0ABX5SNG2_9MICO|nr:MULTISPECIES: ABC transporter substrate-binding protein [Microbacterium]MCK6068405.1 ABC transporter substrate-binding protein [Microbacterium sp. EYE_512]QBR87675.1 ABC transporter substrate-binding protein [Microbacterium wangchenii]TFV84244.1 ABC transporter substrate-binding protein [Microbacterium sp. dk485]TXK15943.1 ABC transporter substrate-binding protein [Microbacterium wangchenii]
MAHTMRRRLLTGAAAVAIGALALSACSSQRDGGGGEETASGDVDSTFVFGASGDPSSLDPAFASDGESFRISRQIFEGLVGVEPGTADPAPLLAESWEQSEDGLSYTFQLKEGVTFHDGTEFTADAVCFNFDRQNNFTGIAQSESLSYYWGKIMRGYADTGTSIYDSCEVVGDTEVTVNLSQPFAGFIAALSLPAFAMQSPAALEEYNADDVGGTSEAPTLSEYATAHPTGTGPFMFDSWEPGSETTVTAYEDYWGEQGQVEEVIFRVIGDTTARRQALESGSIDGYDLVAPADLGALEDAGFTLVNRDPFNVLYLGMNSADPALSDIRVRQAIAHAIDKEQLVSQVLPEGTEIAEQFMPDSVIGFNDDVTTYEYDPEAAETLLAEAGFSEASPLTLTFNYPVNISRPYMPNPEQIFTNLQSQLEAVGIVLNPVSNEWAEYLDLIQGGSDHGIHLLGWTGDYNDPDNFVGTFFGAPSSEWGFDNPELFAALTEARGLASVDEQEPAYQDVNEQIAQFLPGVPLASPVPTLAFAERVVSYPASPVQDEVYNMIELSE